jgi:hypothetical protein
MLGDANSFFKLNCSSDFAMSIAFIHLPAGIMSKTLSRIYPKEL